MKKTKGFFRLPVFRRSTAAGPASEIPNSTMGVTTTGLVNAAKRKASQKAEPKPFPVIGKWTLSRQLGLVGGVLLVFLVTAIGLFGLGYNEASDSIGRRDLAIQLEALAQRVAKDTQRAVAGNAPAYLEVNYSVQQIESAIKVLREGDSALPPATEHQVHLNRLADSWAVLGKTLSTFAASREPTVKLYADAQRVESGMQGAIADLEAISMLYLQGGMPTRDIEAVNALAVAGRSALTAYTSIVRGTSANASAGQQLDADLKLIASGLQQLASSVPEARSGALRADTAWRLAEVANAIKPLQASWASVQERLKAVVDGKAAAAESVPKADDFFVWALAAHSLFDDDLREAERYYVGAGLASIFAVLALLLLPIVNARQAKRQAFIDAETAKRNELATNKVFEVIQQAADGDLTGRAEVSEEHTGATADAVNMLIRNVRRVVSKAGQSLNGVLEKIDASNSVTTQLTRTATTQAEAVRLATADIASIVHSVESVAGQARTAAELAQRTEDAVGEGRTAVARMLGTNEEIRKDVQQAQKAVKALGERAQGLNEIVDALSKLAVQTQVIAMNASVQAEGAGAEGRRFQVIAREMTKLAGATQEHVREVAKTVQGMQVETRQVIERTDMTVQRIVEGTTDAQRAGETFASIAGLAIQQGEQVRYIETTTKEQLAQTESVTEHVEQMKVLTSSAQDGVERVKETATQVQSAADGLAKDMRKFKVA